MIPTRATHVNFPKNAEHCRAPPGRPAGPPGRLLQYTTNDRLAVDSRRNRCVYAMSESLAEPGARGSHLSASQRIACDRLSSAQHFWNENCTRIKCTGESSRKLAPLPGWALGLQYIEIRSSPRTSPNLPLRYSEHGNDLHRLPNNQSRKTIRALDET